VKIDVTGASGKAGRAVVRHLRAHGHEVPNVDKARRVLGYEPAFSRRTIV
jgi:nucleoside-diphosphate-sugar epimerase